MDNKLGIQELALAFAERYGYDTKSSMVFVKTVFEIVEEYVSKDKLVKIKGFGTFKLISVSDRESINVNTGERIVIASHSKLTFTPDAALRDAVNRPFSDFETTPLSDSTSLEAMEHIPSVEEASQNNLPIESIECEVQPAIVFVEECDVQEESSPLNDTDAINQFVDNDEDSAVGNVIENTNESVEVVSEDANYNTDEQEKTDIDLNETSSDPNNLVLVVEESCMVEATEEVLPREDAVVEESETVHADLAGNNQHRIIQNTSNAENSHYPMSSEPVLSTGSSKSSRIYWYVLLTLVLMSLSYVCGHYKVLGMIDVNLYSENELKDNVSNVTQSGNVSEPTVNSTEPVVSDAVSDTLHNDSVGTQENQVPEESPEEIAKYYPQVPGGEYWIVGNSGRVHYMEVGETLYRIARKELGDQNLVRYLIVFNKFEDPNIIHTGDPIRIPKLVKKALPKVTEVEGGEE